MAGSNSRVTKQKGAVTMLAGGAETDRERANDHKNTTAVDDRLQDPPRVIYGWRLHLSMFGLSFALLTSALETTIISTSLQTIGSDFDDYTDIGWVVTAYLVTYSSFLLAYAKLSDIFGQRNLLLVAIVIFAVFSGLCGAAQSMNLTKLIIFRAFQGIGGSGIFAIVFVTVIDVCPVKWLGFYSSVTSSTFGIANLLGPIIGGAISQTGQWKWIFLLNVPSSAIAAILIMLAMPDGDAVSFSSLLRVDFVGIFLSIGCAVLLIYGLQTGGINSPWDSATIIATIAVGGGLILAFFSYEYYISKRKPLAEPLFPWRLVEDPLISLLLMSSFFMGCCFYAIVINIPQRNQIVYLNSPTLAGIRVLPILLILPVFAAVAGVMLSKSVKYAWHILVVGGIIMTLGTGLLCTVNYTDDVPTQMYGFEVLLGAGLGIMTPTFMILGRVEVMDKDNATIMGAINTFRTMGGCIALSMAQAILHSELPRQLDFLSEELLDEIMLSPKTVIPTLGPQELQVREAFLQNYRLQFSAVTALTGMSLVLAIAGLLISLFRRSKADLVINIETELEPNFELRTMVADSGVESGLEDGQRDERKERVLRGESWLRD